MTTTSDPRLRERLQRAADPLPIDLEARLEGSRHRARSRQVYRRVAAGAVGLAIVAIGAAVVWNVRHVDGSAPLVPPEFHGSVVYTTKTGAADGLRVATPGADAFTSLSVDGSPEGSQPVFSPDGRSVAYAVPTGATTKDNWPIEDLVVQRLPDGAPQVLVPDIALLRDPVWGPDGRLAIWTYTKPFHLAGDLRVVEPDGTVGDPVVHVQADIPAFAWSPDGSTFAIGLDRGSLVGLDDASAKAILLIPADGSEHRRIPVFGRDGTGRDTITAIDWAPDGSTLAIEVFPARDGDRELVGDIWVMHADGTDLHPITPEGTYSASASWSPDGEWIAFTSDRDIAADQRAANRAALRRERPGDLEGFGLYAMRPDGSEVTRLVVPLGRGIPRILAWRA
jgi:dipeptidyl aminopeptidase/acylaminoacyl peptidase